MSNMKVNRRDFVKSAVGAGVAATAFTRLHSVHGNVIGSNGRINLAVIGVGGRGRSLLDWAMKTGAQEKTGVH